MKDRTKGLGTSDAAPACGLSKWKSKVELYLEKRGEMPPAYQDEDRYDEALQLEMGRVLEPVALRRFEKKTGLTVSHRQHEFLDTDWPTRWATADGMASDGGYVEAKSVGLADPRFWGDEYTVNAVPIEYLAQIHHAFGCLTQDVQHAWVPVIVLNRSFRVYRVERDESFVESIREQEQEFWSHVMSGMPPKAESERDAKLLWPAHRTGKVATATKLDYARYTALGNVREIQRQYKEARTIIETQLKASIGDAEALVYEDDTLVTWKKARDGWKFDLVQFTADHPKHARDYMKTNPGSRRFLYKGDE